MIRTSVGITRIIRVSTLRQDQIEVETMKVKGIVILLGVVVAASAWECADMCNNKVAVAACGCLKEDSNECRWFNSRCVLESCGIDYELKPNSHCDLSTKPETEIKEKNLPAPPSNGDRPNQP